MSNKTRENNASVVDFLNTVENEVKRNDCFDLLKLLTELRGEEPKMWGDLIIGFGKYHYKYKSGREGDWMRLGISSRKKSITIYFLSGLDQF